MTNDLIKAADALADAVAHERNMVCQDIGMQQDVAQAVDDALTAYRLARSAHATVSAPSKETNKWTP